MFYHTFYKKICNIFHFKISLMLKLIEIYIFREEKLMTKRHKVMLVIGLIVTLVLILGIGVASAFNKATKYRNDIYNNRALIVVAVEARFDKLEELLTALNGLEDHVETQLDKITEARKAFTTADATEIEETFEEIESGVNLIRIMIEDNPDSFIATAAYNNYMAEITATINAITSSKVMYNDAVTAYNTFIQTFPRNLFLSTFGFDKMDLYEPNILIN